MSKTYYDTPLWDSSLSIEERLDYLLSEMTLEEKIQSMGTGNPEIERLGVPAFQVGGETPTWVEKLHMACRRVMIKNLMFMSRISQRFFKILLA